MLYDDIICHKYCEVVLLQVFRVLYEIASCKIEKEIKWKLNLIYFSVHNQLDGNFNLL